MADPIPSTDKLSVVTPEADALPNGRRDPLRNDNREAPTAPKMSGAVEDEVDPLPNPVANRDTEGPRKASTTPRPTDKPLG